MAKLEESAMEEMTKRLSGLSDLHLPFALSCQGDSLSRADKKAHLFDLINRDASVFLERHGSKLNVAELKEFDALNGDYEVDWHLKQLRRSLFPASAKEQKARANLVKNRRLAFMDRLIQDGDFFSENSMRMRAPLLYYEYLGQFQDPSEHAFARQGERWSDMLIRQGEEAEYQARLKTEREKAGISTDKEDSMHMIPEEEEEEEEEEEDEEDEDEEEEEDSKNKEEEEEEDSENEEEDEDEDEEEEEDSENEEGKEEEPKQQRLHERDGSSGAGLSSFATEAEGNTELSDREPESRVLSFEERQQLKLERFSKYMLDKFVAGESNPKPTISREELESNMDDFTRIMQEKFLSGEDSDHFDYIRIDNDTALDDYWLEEMSQDAEDRYFEED
ncbi:hypothetical protein GOP47_0003177 [Adiantum capillus-veneris]|uniref:CCD97-like C-terminal domain-containing protein n=1 Tax=Adiantum capillus-veneris TaxID=13818 RepID=A0A9D4VC97_ADICA|nr:hypothetical protein GOP47_0003177 [Adiantum capillus-veneris]